MYVCGGGGPWGPTIPPHSIIHEAHTLHHSYIKLYSFQYTDLSVAAQITLRPFGSLRFQQSSLFLREDLQAGSAQRRSLNLRTTAFS